MEKRRKILVGIIGILGFFCLASVYLHGFMIQEGQAVLYAYPVTIHPDGSGSSSIQELVDKTLIENATHITEADLAEYPAIGEVLTGQRSPLRGFSKTGGVSYDEYSRMGKRYFVSEYQGNYYILLVMLH